MNQFIILGNVASVSYKTEKVMFFTVATNESYLDKKTNEWKKISKFVPVKLFTPSESKQERIQVGAQVFCVGSITNDKTADGKYQTSLVVSRIDILKNKKEGGNEDYPYQDNDSAPDTTGIKDIDVNDDLPF